MSRRPRTVTDPSLLAVVEPYGADVRVGLWRSSPAGPRLEREISTSIPGLPSALAPTGAGRAVVVLAPGQVRCRVCELPMASDSQLELALRLQAESMQLGSVPRHRVAMAVLPGSSGESRSGVILEWPPHDPAPALPAAAFVDRRLGFAADVSALAAMASVPGVTGPLLLIDAHLGMISFAIRTPNGVALRSAREDLRDGGVDAVVQIVVETCLHHGADAASLESIARQVRDAFEVAGGTGFGCGSNDLRRLAAATGAPVDHLWWRTHGVQAGVALAAFGPLTALTSLLPHEPGEEPDALGRLINRLSEPRVLTGMIGAAILAVIFGPLAIAFIDYQLMQWKVGRVGDTEFRRMVAANDRLIAIYRERSTRTWPMTKLLADLACCTPEGIDFEQVTINHDESVTVRGKARRTEALSGPEVVLKMERLMKQSGIFDRITKGWDPPNQLGETQFTLSAAVLRPTQVMALNDETDWGKLTLAERKWGPSARPGARTGEAPAGTTDASGGGSAASSAPLSMAGNGAAGGSATDALASASRAGAGVGAGRLPSASRGTPPPAVAEDTTQQPEDPAVTEAAGANGEAEPGRRAVAGARRANERNLATVTEPGNERAGGRAGPAAIEPETPPPPLTDEEIAAMTREEALAAASIVAKARSNKQFDEATIERLRTEFTKLMAHVRTLTP